MKKQDAYPRILTQGIESDVQYVKESVISALRVANNLSELPTTSATPNMKQVDSALAEITRVLALSPQTKETRELLERVGDLSRLLGGDLSRENLIEKIPPEDAPPVWFDRIPRLEGPIVDIRLLAESNEHEPSPASGLESFLDSIFAPSDAIYQETFHKLRTELIELYNRNLALELNLDMAEREVRHWRSLYISSPRHAPSTQPQSPVSPVKKPLVLSRELTEAKRVIQVDAWKHAVAKFIGSFDQFSMLKVLLHWRMHVADERRLRAGTG